MEIAASLSARASASGRRHGLAVGREVVEPGSGRAHLERVLEALARADFAPGGPPPGPPVPPDACVLVGTVPRPGDWADRRIVRPTPTERP